MRSGGALAWVFSLSCLAALPSVGATGDAKPVSIEMVRQYTELMRGLNTPQEVMQRLIETRWHKRVGGELGEYLDTQIVETGPVARDVVLREYTAGSPEIRKRVLELYAGRWHDYVGGVDPMMNVLVARELRNPDPATRRIAGRIIAENALPGIANMAIDAAIEYPEIEVAVLRSLMNSRDTVGSRWAIGRLASLDPQVRQAALGAIWATASQAAPLLRVQLEQSDPALQEQAIEGLLVVASRQDVDRLALWLEHHPDHRLADRVAGVIAALQAGSFRSEPPRLVPFPPDSR